MIAIQLPAGVEDRLDKVARETGRDKEEHALKAILRYLDDLEDVSIATDRIKRNGPKVSLEELGRELGMER